MSIDTITARSLVDLEEARRYVWRDENDTSRDELLVDAVSLVSDAIWDYCRREFKPTATATARVFSIGPGGWVDLSPYDLRTLTSVVRYTDRDAAFQETLTADGYRLHPAGRTPAGTYLHLQLAAPRLAELEEGFGWQVTVTGDWGMATTPDTVKLACLQWIDNLVKNPGSWAQHAMSGYVVAPDTDFASPTPAGMPAAVRHRLAAWRRFPVVM